ncbi:MAG: hypothetical protein JWN44_4724 [Myxococcales bacterium]|nr:hypothetical protein [Myxococcales bacterium]
MARILVVDDQALNRELIRAFLDGSDHELVDAGSGEEALAAAERQPPDLVLLDVMMPGIDGYETTQRLKEQAGDKFLPVILLTSLADSTAKVTGLLMGADEFLTKPIDRRELTARIRNLLALRAKDIALRDKVVALAELNRFKDEMAGLLIHDLKNPLSVILANCEYLSDGLRGMDGCYVEALEDSKAASRRMLRLLANLYDVGCLEGSRMDVRRTAANLIALLTDIAKQRKVLAASRMLTIDVAGNPDVTVSIDVDLITRTIENILDNSMRHTPPGGRVELSASLIGDHPQIRIGNTGVAIPVEARSVIFEKFGQAVASAGRMNLGLGLYFCRLAVEAHGGRIWVEETQSLPTVFAMQFPR